MVSKEAILKMIGDHNGTWGWYQLERVVNPRNLPPGRSVMDLVKELMNDGLIVQLPTEPMPYYALTDLGRSHYESTLHDHS
jgi:DNA-binding HxlR family transcriptional regulator